MISTKPTASTLDLAKSTALSGSRLTSGIAQNRNLTPYLTGARHLRLERDGSTTITKTGKQVFFRGVHARGHKQLQFYGDRSERPGTVCSYYKMTGETPATCTKAGVRPIPVPCNDKNGNTGCPRTQLRQNRTYAWNGINCTAERGYAPRDSSHRRRNRHSCR